MNIIERFFFVYYPYIAISICVIGCILRYDREPYSWKAGSSQLMSKKNTRLANNLFHVGILGILGGHFVGLLTPDWLYHHFISSPHKQLLAMVAGGIAGIMCMVGLVMLIKRRFTEPRVRATSSFADNAILIILVIQLTLGLTTILISTHHMDGETMVAIARWFQSGWTFSTESAYAAMQHVSIVYKLHIILGFTIILLVPFNRLHHAISAPVWYLFRNYQIVRKRSPFKQGVKP